MIFVTKIAGRKFIQFRVEVDPESILRVRGIKCSEFNPWLVLGGGRKPENQQETHMDTKRTRGTQTEYTDSNPGAVRKALLSSNCQVHLL